MIKPTDITDNIDAGRFELRVDDGLAVLEYRCEGNRLYLLHTEVPEALTGQGLAGTLARAALEHARAAGLRVVPWCPFVRAYLQQHPEYAALAVDG
jgi:uncharacterized protein